MLNPSKGNMYEFITHTWNPIKGYCSHNCPYCYMKQFNPNARPPRLVESELNSDLGRSNFIFIGSGIDIFAKDIPSEWITRVLDRCKQEHGTTPKNAYLLQTKNPKRFLEFVNHPATKQCVFATTIETNRFYPDIMFNAPLVEERVEAMEEIANLGFTTMVTAEPLIQFDLHDMVSYIKKCKPKLVNIGRNSRREILLPEPSNEEVKQLIVELKKFTKVHVKKNARAWLA